MERSYNVGHVSIYTTSAEELKALTQRVQTLEQKLVFIGALIEDLDANDGSFKTTITQEMYNRLSVPGAVVHALLPYGYGYFCGVMSHVIAGEGGVDLLTSTFSIVSDGTHILLTMVIDKSLVVKVIPAELSTGGN